MGERDRDARGYALAVASIIVAVVLRLLLSGVIGASFPFATLFVAVLVTAGYGGLRPALLATVLGGIASVCLLLPSDYGFSGEAAENLGGLALYFAVSLGISAIGEVLRRAQRRAEFTSTQFAAERERLRITLQSIGDAVVATDTRGLVTSMNSVAEELTGWRLHDAAGRPLSDVFRIVNERSRQAETNPVERVLAEGRIIGLANHTLLVAKDGTEKPIDDSAAPIRDGEGNLVGVVLVFRDLTEHRRAEALVRRSEQDLNDFFENANMGLHWVGPDGIILRVNRAELELLGYERDEYVGRHIAEFHVDRAAIDDILHRLSSGETIQEYPARLRCKDGTIRDVLINSTVLWENGSFIHTRCFTLDVTERKRAEERLRRADRRKDEFLATLAHELRNPLAPVRSSIEIMKRAAGDGAAVEKARSTIDRQMSHLERLVDDLLDVSRITRDRLELRPVRAELASIVHQAVETCRPLAEQRRHEVSIDLPSEPIYLRADPVRLAQVFSNLLSNACKYTDPGGRISLAARREEDQIRVAVKDSGVGIPAGMLGRVFDMFAQGQAAADRMQGGLGIGLTLVRRLVDMHGGRVEGFSEGPNLGSEFVVRLPILLDPSELAPAPPAVERVVPPRRVLIVDDNRDAAESLAVLLGISGHETHVAHDGIAAIEAAETFRPQVVLLDIGLPKLSGHDAARRIRQQPWGRDILLVALTGWGQDDDRRKSMETGFDHHLVKPIDLESLNTVLASVRGQP